MSMEFCFLKKQPAEELCKKRKPHFFMAPLLAYCTRDWMNLIKFALMGHEGDPQVLWSNVRNTAAFGNCHQVNKGLIWFF